MKPAQDFTLDELSVLMDGFKELKDWMSSVEEYALSLAQSGTPIPNYTLGTARSTRVWGDPVKVIMTLESEGIDVDTYYPRELLTPSQMEKTLGKQGFNVLVADQVAQKIGSPKLIRNK
jgi:hypothetical protein